MAITDAFYFDTFAAVGLELTAIRSRSARHDLSDRGAELKTTVQESLRLFIDSSQSVHEVFGQVRDNVDQTAHAMTGIAAASTQVAEGARVVRLGRTMSFGRVTLSSASDNKPVAMVSSAFAML